MLRRTFLPVLFGGAGVTLAQNQGDLNIVVPVNIVVAPTTVRDKNGQYVNGLEPKDFILYDNGKPQNIKVEFSYVPISLVVAVQANDSMEPVLPMIKKIGPLIESLIIGTEGEAALIKYDHRIDVIQPFTNDGRVLTRALNTINAGSSTARTIDVVFEASRLLRNRPANHRKVLLLIAETRDAGSEGKLRDALTEIQVHNIAYYQIDVNRAIGMLTKKMPPPRPDPVPIGARPVPGGAPMTPGTIEAMTGYRGQTTNFVPVFVEIFRDVKAIFVSNPAEVFTRYTGGREFSMTLPNQKALEKVIGELGEELHSQYLISYSPTNKMEGGWHDIKVEVAKLDLKVTTREGYWMAAVPEGK